MNKSLLEAVLEILCVHKWKQFRVHYNPKKYPSTYGRKCEKCGKVQYKQLHCNRWVKPYDSKK